MPGTDAMLDGAIVLISGFTQDLHEDTGTRTLYHEVYKKYHRRNVAIHHREWDDRDLPDLARSLASCIREGGRCCIRGFSYGAGVGVPRFCKAYGRPVDWVGFVDGVPRAFHLGFIPSPTSFLNWASGGDWFDTITCPKNVVKADFWRQDHDRPRGRWIVPSHDGQEIIPHVLPRFAKLSHSEMDRDQWIMNTVMRRLEAVYG